METLPLSGLAAGIYFRRGPADGLLVNPAMVNGAAVRRSRRAHAPAVEDLNFVEPLQVNSRIRAPRNHEFDVEFHITMLHVRHEVYGPSRGAIENAITRLRPRAKSLGVFRDVEQHGPRGEPGIFAHALLGVPAREVVSVQKWDPSVAHQVGRISPEGHVDIHRGATAP